MPDVARDGVAALNKDRRGGIDIRGDGVVAAVDAAVVKVHREHRRSAAYRHRASRVLLSRVDANAPARVPVMARLGVVRRRENGGEGKRGFLQRERTKLDVKIRDRELVACESRMKIRKPDMRSGHVPDDALGNLLELVPVVGREVLEGAARALTRIERRGEEVARVAAVVALKASDGGFGCPERELVARAEIQGALHALVFRGFARTEVATRWGIVDRFVSSAGPSRVFRPGVRNGTRGRRCADEDKNKEGLHRAIVDGPPHRRADKPRSEGGGQRNENAPPRNG